MELKRRRPLPQSKASVGIVWNYVNSTNSGMAIATLRWFGCDLFSLKPKTNTKGAPTPKRTHPSIKQKLGGCHLRKPTTDRGGAIRNADECFVRSCPRSCSLPWRCHAVRPYQPFASTLAIPLSNLCLPRTRKRKVLLDVIGFNRKIRQRPAFPGWKLMATSMAVGSEGFPRERNSGGQRLHWEGLRSMGFQARPKLLNKQIRNQTAGAGEPSFRDFSSS